MSGLALHFDIRDLASVQLRNTDARFQRGEYKPALGEGLVLLFQSHFQALAGARHGSSSPRNFYADAAKKTNWHNQPTGLSVDINQEGIAQRFFGGTITGRPNLAIPANPAVAGKRAAQVYDEMHLQFRPYHGANSFGALVAVRAVAEMITPKRGKGKGFKATGSVLGEVVMFWLCKSVDQKADSSVLPAEAAIRAQGDISLRNWWAGVNGAS